MTKTINIELGKESYDILIAENLLNSPAANFAQLKSYSKIIIITDGNIAKTHLTTLTNSLNSVNLKFETLIIKPGEQQKSFQSLEKHCEEILRLQPDRNSLIIAFGGGVVGDLSGFIASIMLRGIDFIQIPTSLLAQVDSSIGGKTAINSKNGKNLIGSFYQPKLVLIDINMLDTLSEREYYAGYAEIVKYGLINSADFFQLLDTNRDKVKNRDKKFLAQIIATSCQAKAEIVAQDSKEKGIRALLNLGHSFAHSLEKETNYANILNHGEAVSIGMCLAAEFSESLGLISNQEVQQIIAHLKFFDMPTKIQDIDFAWKADNLFKNLFSDKKNKNNQLVFILMQGIGKSFISEEINAQEVEKFIKNKIN
jgi:3-dehydroquinate synthase